MFSLHVLHGFVMQTLLLSRCGGGRGACKQAQQQMVLT